MFESEKQAQTERKLYFQSRIVLPFACFSLLFTEQINFSHTHTLIYEMSAKRDESRLSSNDQTDDSN